MADRVMYDAVCSGCGCETRVPFQPKGNKGVLCRECYRQEKDQEAGRRQQDEADQPRLFDDQASQAAPATPPARHPNATPAAAEMTALAVRSVGKSEVLALSPNQSAEITWMEVRVEPAMTYKVGSIKAPDGRWVDQLGVLSNFWDFMGQLRGLSFSSPKILENTEDRAVVEITATYLNQQGREISDTEVYEIDCARMLKVSRLKWPAGAKVATKGEVEEEPVYDGDGNLTDFRRKLPAAAEKELWDTFLGLKRNKLAKAITCAHRRLIQRAVGTKTLTAGALALQFPVIRQRFTDAQIHEAVASVYGDEDFEPSDLSHEVVEAEVVEDAPPPAPAPEPTPAADDRVQRNELYRAIFGIGKQCGDKNEAAVRERLALWKCCGQKEHVDPDTGEVTWEPSLRASSIEQLQASVARYERLLEETELADQAPF